ncbi:MAG: Synechococcus phage [Candidatus Parcubacteria bacterium]
MNGVGYNSGNLGSLVFDGVNDYATVSNNITPGTGDFAVSVWVYKTETVSNRYIWDFGANGGMLSSGTSIGRGFRYYNPTIGTGSSLYNAGPVHNINTWYNIVISRISGTTYFYSNGSLVTSGADGGNIGSWGTTLNIGRYGGGGYIHQGNLSSLLVYKGKGLTPQEIQQNFNATRGRFGL